MPKLTTNVKSFRRLDVGSMNSRIYIYDRAIQAPYNIDLNFTQKFIPKLSCWALLDTTNGVSMFDQSNIERIITHIFSIRNVPQDSRINSPVFNGDIKFDLNDLSASGTYTFTSKLIYRVEIDSIGTNDTFRWSIDDGITWIEESVLITGLQQDLSNGVKITFTNVNGHTLGNYWYINATAGLKISSQDWIFYQNQFMNIQSIYDIIKVETMGEEGRYLNLWSTLTGDQGIPANYA